MHCVPVTQVYPPLSSPLENGFTISIRHAGPLEMMQIAF